MAQASSRVCMTTWALSSITSGRGQKKSFPNFSSRLLVYRSTERQTRPRQNETYVCFSHTLCACCKRLCVCDWAAVLKAAFQLIICSAVDPAAEFSRVCGGCAIAAPVLTAQSTTTYIRTENYVISYMKLPVFQPSDPPTFFLFISALNWLVFQGCCLLHIIPVPMPLQYYHYYD